jgi:hypothetical protein
MPLLSTANEVDSTCPVLHVGINESSQLIQSTSTLFPNPFSQSATIRFNKEVRNATLRVYNLFGETVRSEEHISGTEILLLRNASTPLSMTLTEGIYFYEVMEKGMWVCSGKAVVIER